MSANNNGSEQSPFDDGTGSKFNVPSAEGRRVPSHGRDEDRRYADQARSYARRQR